MSHLELGELLVGVKLPAHNAPQDGGEEDEDGVVELLLLHRRDRGGLGRANGVSRGRGWCQASRMALLALQVTGKKARARGKPNHPPHQITRMTLHPSHFPTRPWRPVSAVQRRSATSGNRCRPPAGVTRQLPDQGPNQKQNAQARPVTVAGGHHTRTRQDLLVGGGLRLAWAAILST